MRIKEQCRLRAKPDAWLVYCERSGNLGHGFYLLELSFKPPLLIMLGLPTVHAVSLGSVLNFILRSLMTYQSTDPLSLAFPASICLPLPIDPKST